MVAERMGVVSTARVQLKRLEKERDEIEGEYSATVTSQIEAERRGLPSEPYFRRMEQITRRLEEIRAELVQAEAEAATDVNTLDSLRELLAELSAIVVGWDTATNNQRREIFAQWIKSISIVTESAPDSRFATRRLAEVVLRLGPASAVIDLDAGLHEDAVSNEAYHFSPDEMQSILKAAS